MNEEEDNETLYREMNTDDDFYMGEPTDENDRNDPTENNNSANTPNGCVILFIASIIFIAVAWTLYYLFKFG